MSWLPKQAHNKNQLAWQVIYPCGRLNIYSCFTQQCLASFISHKNFIQGGLGEVSNKIITTVTEFILK